MIILILSNRLLVLPKMQRPAIKTKVKYVLLQMMDPAIFKDMEIAHQLWDHYGLTFLFQIKKTMKIATVLEIL